MEEVMGGLKTSEAHIAVHVHPSKANTIYEAVRQELSFLLFKFNEDFDGVVLAYVVEIVDKFARISPSVLPYLGVKVKVNMLLLSPKPDMLLEGKVVKLSPESVHATVLGFASAIITLDDIREDFEYKTKRGEAMFSSRTHRRHRIKAGTLICFLVKSFDEEILHFSGSLVPPRTGDVRWLSMNVETDSKLRKPDQIKDDKCILNSHSQDPGHAATKRKREEL